MTVEIPYKAKISLLNREVIIIGARDLQDKMKRLKALYGDDPTKWSLVAVENGHDILINEFIMKLKGQFKFCYTHVELCHCRNVETEKVFTNIKDGCFTVEDVSRATKAGTGCGSCRKDIEDLIKQFKVS